MREGMNILLINHYAGSPEMGMEFRPYYFAREWVRKGHHVDIVAADYSHLRMKNPEVCQDFQTEVIDGITYHWIKTGQYEGNGAARAMTMFRFVGKLWRHAGKMARKWKPDVVITSSTYPLDTYAGRRIAKRSGARLIHEVHDLWPLTLTEVGGISRHHPFVLLLQMAEHAAYKKSEYVVSLLPLTKKYMIRHGMNAEKFVEIPNGIRKEDWERPEALPERQKEILERYKRDGKFIVGYFGGHALSNALDILLDAAKAVKDRRIQFVLTGNGVEKPHLMERADKEEIKNVCFLDPVSKKAIPNLVSYFDCIYMGAMDSPLYRFGICLNKMYDGMMAGKPIICAVNTPTAPIETYGCGMMVRTADPVRQAAAVEKMCRLDQNERYEMGECGRRAVLDQFTYDILASKFESLFIRKGLKA